MNASDPSKKVGVAGSFHSGPVYMFGGGGGNDDE